MEHPLQYGWLNKRNIDFNCLWHHIYCVGTPSEPCLALNQKYTFELSYALLQLVTQGQLITQVLLHWEASFRHDSTIHMYKLILMVKNLVKLFGVHAISPPASLFSIPWTGLNNLPIAIIIKGQTVWFIKIEMRSH